MVVHDLGGRLALVQARARRMGGLRRGGRDSEPRNAKATTAPPLSALDALLSAGTIDARKHAAGLAPAALRARFE